MKSTEILEITSFFWLPQWLPVTGLFHFFITISWNVNNCSYQRWQKSTNWKNVNPFMVLHVSHNDTVSSGSSSALFCCIASHLYHEQGIFPQLLHFTWVDSKGRFSKLKLIYQSKVIFDIHNILVTLLSDLFIAINGNQEIVALSRLLLALTVLEQLKSLGSWFLLKCDIMPLA